MGRGITGVLHRGGGERFGCNGKAGRGRRAEGWGGRRGYGGWRGNRGRGLTDEDIQALLRPILRGRLAVPEALGLGMEHVLGIVAALDWRPAARSSHRRHRHRLPAGARVRRIAVEARERRVLESVGVALDVVTTDEVPHSKVKKPRSTCFSFTRCNQARSNPESTSTALPRGASGGSCRGWLRPPRSGWGAGPTRR